MQKTILSYLVLLALLLTGLQTVQAQSERNHMSIGVKGGSTGIGGEFAVSLNKKFNTRISASFLDYTYSGEADLEATVGYDAVSSMTSIGLVVDYFPFKKFLKLSAGLHYFDFQVDGFVAPTEPYTVEGKEFSVEKLGSISSTMDYESKIAPYLGLGFGNSVRQGFPVRFTMDIGALYTDSPRINSSGEGIIAPTAEQGKDFEDGLKDFKFYPVLNLGFSIRIR
ncbi:MAG: hypothetical protein RIC57_10420 [Balneola sp.]